MQNPQRLNVGSQPSSLSREVTKLGSPNTSLLARWLSRLLACRLLGQSALRSPAAPQLPSKTQIPLTCEHLAINCWPSLSPAQHITHLARSSSHPCHTRCIAIVGFNIASIAFLSTTIHTTPDRPHPLRPTTQWLLLPPRLASRCSSVC